MTSRRAALWIAGHQALLFPLVAIGRAHRYRARVRGAGVRVVCVGRQERFETLLARVLPRAELVGASRGQLVVRNPEELWPANADLVAVELHPWLAERFRSAGWLVCPEHVRWEGPLSRMPPAKPSKSLRSDLNRIAGGGYLLEVTPGSSRDWEEFEQEMLIPHAKRRFGERAWIPSSALMRALRKRGVLHFVRKDGRRVGGACVISDGDAVWVPAGGIKDGDLALMREGADAAQYWLTIEWARHRGGHRIDFGRTSPFYFDGIARFKRKWGMSAVADPLTRLIAIRVSPGNKALRQAMERQPFLIVDSDGALRRYPR